jgi:hypothetical protein
MTQMTQEEWERIPHAHHVIARRCIDPECRALHIALCDEDDRIFAVAVLMPDQIAEIVSAGLN